MENNIKALELMILSSTLLSNDSSSLWRDDALKLLTFLGSAFDLNPEEFTNVTTSIINAASTIVTTEDATVTLIDQISDSATSEVEYLKTKTLLYLQSFFDIDPLHFMDYRYANPYLATLHFHNINTMAKDGYIIAIRHLALLYHLGIGTKADPKRAKRLLWNCAFWADEYALVILKEIAREEKNSNEYDELRALLKLLEQGLYDGTTEISDEKTYSKNVQEKYKLIASIFHDIIATSDRLSKMRDKLNASFVEVMQLPHLPYAKKMTYINEYYNGEWKNETNKITASHENIGFLGGKK